MKTNTIRHKIVGDTTIDEDTKLHGLIAGTVTVAEDTILQLHGKVAGSLILLPRSAAFVHGTVDAAIVEVLLQTGMRLSELARLTVRDVELPRRINREPDNTGSVRIRRKGGKEATIPLNRFARLARRWLRG